MAINRIKTFFTIAYYGLVVIGCRRKGLFLVYSLEEDESPPLEGDGMSARFIGELVHQEILCSWHQVVVATHSLQEVDFCFC